MHTFPVLFVLAPAAMLLLMTACKSQTEATGLLAGTVVVGPEYSASRGLFVPDDTRRSLGLEVAEVDEQPVVGSESLSLFIFDTSPDGPLASGILTAAQAGFLRAGQHIEVNTPRGELLTGEVIAVHAAQSMAGAPPEVVVRLPPTEENLQTVSFVTASVRRSSAGPVARVPRSALVRATDGDFVYTVSGNHFVRTMVDVGVMTDQAVEVTGGLYRGDLVVTKPVMSLWLTELAAVKGGHACCAVPGEALQ